ncbi:hypothetical protein AO368_0221 [Moraxella catarrhalis]|nr:hypothetical protein AO368_0221 [Moraxella catarrhalis]
MVAAEFGLSVLAVSKRVTKSGCPLVASLMADLTLVISLSPALMPSLLILTLPTVKPLSVSIPKVTFLSAVLVLTVMPFSPAKVSSLLVLFSVMPSVFVSLPPLTVRFCRAVSAVPLASVILVCRSVLAASNACLLMASVSCTASPTLEIALPPALIPVSLLISTVPTFSFSLSRYGLLSSSEPALSAKPTLSLVM